MDYQLPMLCPVCSVISVGRTCLQHHRRVCVRMRNPGLFARIWWPEAREGDPEEFPGTSCSKPRVKDCFVCDTEDFFVGEIRQVTRFVVMCRWIMLVYGLICQRLTTSQTDPSLLKLLVLSKRSGWPHPFLKLPSSINIHTLTMILALALNHL